MTALADENTPEAKIRLIEDNGAEFLVALGRAAGAEERREPHLHWVIGNSPLDYHNAVVYANLAPDTADIEIAASIAAFRRHRVPGTWHVGPSMRPLDLGERLLQQGFTYGGYDIGMAAGLGRLPDHLPVPAGLTIERVRDEQGLLAWINTLAQGFGEGEIEAQWVGEMYRRIGLDDNVPWRHYLGWLNGEPVATASSFFGAGVAGIYFVMTVPAARRQGIGAAVTLIALQEAHGLGYRIGVLGSSLPGYSVYKRLGFEEYCRVNLYEWRPPEEKE
jgi:GNAT superfamily N-acetyltransferase